MAAKTSVKFVSDIPKIERAGGSRKSKYDELLDEVQKRGKVAMLTFDTPGAATSRYTSIKNAIDNREDSEHYEVCTRNVEDGVYNVYVAFNEEADETETPKRKKKSTKKSESEEDSEDF